MKTVYLGLGTNQGDLKENLRKTIKLLKYYNITVLKTSSIYETEPVGFKEQPHFYNLCLEAETSLDPHELLKMLKAIEIEMGRQKTAKNGPRIIDIDILIYSNIILKDKDLVIPHSEIISRRFVLEPLYEIAPELVHPELNVKIEAILKENKLSGDIRRIGEL